jgi:hypothetical protein
MHCAKKAALVSVPFLAALVYAGYRLYRSEQSLKWYKGTYGYATSTVGLPDCVLDNSAWKGIVIDSAIAFTDGAHNIRPFDIDDDGDLELVTNAYRSDTLMVYDAAQNRQDPRAWTRQVITSNVGGGFPRHPMGAYVKALIKRSLIGIQIEGAHYTAIADLSGNGGHDLAVAGDLTRGDVTWYEAVPDAGSHRNAWVRHVAYQDDSHRTYHIETGDIDLDGDSDIVFTTKTDHSIGWLENRGTPAAWPAVIVDSNCIMGFYAKVADVDRDGNAEIMASSDNVSRGGQLYLYVHSGDPRSAGDWTRHSIARLPPGSGFGAFTIVDLDGDGNLDVAGANHEGAILLLKNPWPGDVSHPWEMHLPRMGNPDGQRDFREIDVGDIDLDGDLDIIVADEGRNAVLWYENPGETFCDDWRRHVVDQSDVYLRWCHCVRLADIDKDGDLDVAVAAAGSNVFLLYLNQITSNPCTRVAGVPPSDP